MSVTVTYEVWCDADGCMEWYGSARTPTAVRRSAKMEGWVRRQVDGKRKDLCPVHASPRP